MIEGKTDESKRNVNWCTERLIARSSDLDILLKIDSLMTERCIKFENWNS